MSLDAVFLGLVLLQAKHLVFDFLIQTPFMYANKGRYGHPGGVLHACLHGAGTFAVLLVFPIPHFAAALIALAEALFHYHVDWAKDRLVVRLGQTERSPGYWSLLGIDQAIHQWTYLAIVFFIAKS